MKTILLIAHGSRKNTSNDEVRQLAQNMQQLTDNISVIPAFLELAKPSIIEGVELCAKLGANEIIAIPYFLSAGRHVIQDVPKELDIGQKNHPNIKITLSNHLGSHPDIGKLLLSSIA